MNVYELCLKSNGVALAELQAICPTIVSVELGGSSLAIATSQPMSESEKNAVAGYNRFTMGEV